MAVVMFEKVVVNAQEKEAAAEVITNGHDLVVTKSSDEKYLETRAGTRALCE